MTLEGPGDEALIGFVSRPSSAPESLGLEPLANLTDRSIPCTSCVPGTLTWSLWLRVNELSTLLRAKVGLIDSVIFWLRFR